MRKEVKVLVTLHIEDADPNLLTSTSTKERVAIEVVQNALKYAEDKGFTQYEYLFIDLIDTQLAQ